MNARSTQLISTLAAAVLCASAATAGIQSQSTSQSAAKGGGAQAKATAHSKAQAGSQSNMSESSQSASISDGDLTVTVTKRVKSSTDAEGNVNTNENTETRATLAGKDVPSDRIRNNGTTVEILDEKGAVIRSIEAPELGDIEVVNGADPSGGHLRVFARSGGKSGASAQSGSSGSAKSGARSSGTFTVSPAGKPMAWRATGAAQPKVMLGVTMESPDDSVAQQLKVNPDETTLIMSVTPDLPAAKAGLKQHDLIVSIDGEKPATPERIRAALQKKSAGDAVKLGVISGGDAKEIAVTLEAWDAARLGVADANTLTYTVDPQFGGVAIDDDMRQQIEQMMKRLESQFGQGNVDIDDPNGLIQQFFAPAPGGKGHTFTFRMPSAVAPAAPVAPPAPDAAAATDERIRQLEERIEKLNETIRLLEKRLQDSQDPNASSGTKSGTKK